MNVMPRDRETQSFPVKSAQRVIDILELFAQRKAPATLTAVAAALSMPKSSCVALLKTLEANGYLYEVRPQAGFYPTRRWLDRATIISTHDPLVQTLRPMMTRLRDETRETLILGKLVTNRVLYLDVVESTETVRYSALAGQFKPIHAAASGKALISVFSPEERRAFIARLTLDRRSPSTITDPDELERNITDGIARGYQISRGENAPDATSIAVPVRVAGDVVVLICAGLTGRMHAREEEIGARLVAARRELESE